MAQLLTDEELDSILREKYPGPGGARRLAENLISIFGEEHPDGITVDGPLYVRQPNPDQPAIGVIPFPGATVPAFPTGGGGGGGVKPGDLVFPDPQPPADAIAVAVPVVLYGIVQSGTGQVYTVRCWMTDPSTTSPLGDYPCFQGQIDPTETIPAGTHCLVWCAVAAGNKLTGFRLNVPVFLPEA